MTTVTQTKIDHRQEHHTVGIRTQVPMKGMFKVVEQLSKELNRWKEQHKVEAAGPRFLRYYVIDMEGEMDIEVGFPVAEFQSGDERVKPGMLPAGKYASVVYIGNGYTGNKTLVEWAKAKGIAWDRWDNDKGDTFRSRYESFLTDPKDEHRKTKWEIEVAIKLAEE
jgi:effector-binding domain-containing protein